MIKILVNKTENNIIRWFQYIVSRYEHPEGFLTQQNLTDKNINYC